LSLVGDDSLQRALQLAQFLASTDEVARPAQKLGDRFDDLQARRGGRLGRSFGPPGLGREVPGQNRGI